MSFSPQNIVAFPRAASTPAPHQAGDPGKALVIPFGPPATGSSTRQQPQSPLNLAQLWNAINENRVTVHYQPQFDFSTGRTRAVEALARIIDESGSLIFPDRFIKQAERSAMIMPLGRMVIDRVCRDLARWRADGMAMDRAAINLSAHQLNIDQSLVDFVEHSLAQYSLAATDLEFELTERQHLDSSGMGMNTLHELARKGARVALGDFGVGYSSVTCVPDLPVSTVKFARSMVTRIPEHRATERVIRHLAALALEAGLTVVAEGIETWDQHDYLSTSGAHLGQGFLFAEPMAQAELVDFVRSTERD